MLKYTLRNAVALSAVAALLLSDFATTASAQASSETEIPAPISPAIEASQVSEQLNSIDGATEDEVSIKAATYEVRVVENAEVTGSENVVARFPLPTGCAPSQSEASLSCDTGELVIEPVVLSLDGESVPHEVAVSDSELVVTATPESTEHPGYAITMYVGDPTERDTLAVASESFAQMLRSETTSAPAPPGSTSPATPEEEDGYIIEYDDNEEADPEEMGEEWEPEQNEYDFAPPEPAIAYGPFKRPKVVSVPRNYVYCPIWVTARCQPKTLHDYCSWSPDSFGYAIPPRGGTIKVSWKGPCARHDLAIESIAKKNISASKKRSQRANSDKTFRTHLRQNCGYYLYGTSTGRTKCYNMASFYYSKVQDATNKWLKK